MSVTLFFCINKLQKNGMAVVFQIQEKNKTRSFLVLNHTDFIQIQIIQSIL